jgi:hypothetical protein
MDHLVLLELLLVFLFPKVAQKELHQEKKE